MAQVDQALRRAAYDIGYKDELIGVLEAEVTALREGRARDADVLRRAREAAPAGARAGEHAADAAAGCVASQAERRRRARRRPSRTTDGAATGGGRGRSAGRGRRRR